MTKRTTTSAFLGTLLATSLAWAQPAPDTETAPTPASPDPDTPEAPPPVEPDAPAPPVDPNATPTPVPEQPSPAPAAEEPVSKGVNQPRSEPATTQPVLGTYYDGPEAGGDGGDAGDTSPTLAVELSLASGGIANQFVQYKGWTLENGVPKGIRLEGNFYGVVAAYELSNMANDQACSDVMCVSGDFGSTTIHMLDIGYRYRFGMIGPVRPFLAGSLGGVLASFGDWAPGIESQWGGSARGGVGIEIPLPAKLFASAFVGYRVVITPNPLRDKAAEKANKVLVDDSDTPNGDFAEDLHAIGGYLGIGMAL